MGSCPTDTSNLRPVEGHFDLDGHRRWYSVRGDLAAEGAPVVVCHGGPGSPHDYLENVPELLGERAVVLYDQLGCGKSKHLPDADPGFWTPELFERELAGLVEHLCIAKRYNVLGQSWGGLLGLVHALERPPGLVSFVVADVPASMSDYVVCLNELVDAMDPDVAAAIREGERTGAIDTPDCQAAMMAFFAAHLCRLDPWPECLTRTLELWQEDPTVAQAMTGMKWLTAAGTLADFDLSDRLAEIEVPVLLITGAHDRVRPWAAEKVQARLARSEWVLFEDSSHFPHLEEPERFGAVVEAFLRSTEGR